MMVPVPLSTANVRSGFGQGSFTGKRCKEQDAPILLKKSRFALSFTFAHFHSNVITSKINYLPMKRTLGKRHLRPRNCFDRVFQQYPPIPAIPSATAKTAKFDPKRVPGEQGEGCENWGPSQK
jgi:hypothetical protein